MFLDLSSEGSSNGNAAVLRARIESVAFGALPYDSVIVRRQRVSDQDIAFEAVEESTSAPPSEQHSFIMVAFQFGDGAGGTETLLRYVRDRAPALERHGGRVYVSAVTPRNDRWCYDGFELIEFPTPDAVQNLMGDADYRARTKNSAAVFGGEFSMARLALAAVAA
ncbi:MAG: hypothetical protein WED00_10810 [Aquisalimonadaceae bacterium]